MSQSLLQGILDSSSMLLTPYAMDTRSGSRCQDASSSPSCLLQICCYKLVRLWAKCAPRYGRKLKAAYQGSSMALCLITLCASSPLAWAFAQVLRTKFYSTAYHCEGGRVSIRLSPCLLQQSELVRTHDTLGGVGSV